MNRKSYKYLALVFVFALVFGSFGAMAPAAAQASDLAGPPPPRMHGNHGNNPHFTQAQMTNPFVRDFDGDCVWWRYELHNGHYVRKYTPCRYGDVEISYRRNYRALWGQPELNTGSGKSD